MNVDISSSTTNLLLLHW